MALLLDVLRIRSRSSIRVPLRRRNSMLSRYDLDLSSHQILQRFKACSPQ